VKEAAKKAKAEEKAEKKAAAKLAKQAKSEERTDIIRTICENLRQSSNISVEVTP
jgi:ATP-dependent DNA ligase